MGVVVGLLELNLHQSGDATRKIPLFFFVGFIVEVLT
jgi:hypothetical protein